MGDKETGGVNDSNQNLESEGLSGIDLRKEDSGLRIAGMASNFVDGKGTRAEPLEPRVSLNLETSLQDLNYLARLLKSDYHLNRTIFVRHGGRLLGVDATANVQFVRDMKWSSDEAWQKEANWLKDFLNNMRNDKNNPENWLLSTVEQNNSA